MKNASICVANTQVSNDAAFNMSTPYVVEAEIEGTTPLLFHRWSCEEVESKSAAAKNSKAKRTDNIEAYLYRDESGFICLPTEYVRQSLIHAAKFRQDPRSPRKSAMDLYKAGVVPFTDLVSLNATAPDYLDRRRVCVQRSGVTRTRPAMNAGWRATVQFQVLTPEYIDPATLLDVLTNAGRLVGVGDFRPTYGRFQVRRFEVLAS